MSTLRALAISLCRANSEPLSVVTVNMALRFLYGASIEKTAFATSSAFFCRWAVSESESLAYSSLQG